MENQWLLRTELIGNKVKLIPLEQGHSNALLLAASDGELWKLWYTSVPSAKTIFSYLEAAFVEQNAGRGLPFLVIDKPSNKVIGTTRYCNASPKDRRLEIGYTWYSKSFQRTGINTECKYLLLKYAFEQLDAIAVEFRTNWHNQQSRTAIARIGAKQDGVLRNHQIDADGTLRDTVVFSIINQEWVAVKKALEFKMSQFGL